MELFRVVFLTFKLSGFWSYCTDQTSTQKTLAYNVYSTLMQLLVYSLCLIKFIYFLNANFSSVDEVISRLFLFPELLVNTFKALCFFRKQDKIFAMLKILSNKYCRPVDSMEIQRQSLFDRKCKWMEIMFYCVFAVTYVLLVHKPILYGFNESSLPLEGCFYFAITSLPRFWLAYLHQCVSIAISFFTTAAHDSLFSGLLIQVCAQADHLKSRLANLPNVQRESGQFNLLKKFVEQHIRMKKLTKMIQDVFSISILYLLIDLIITFGLNMYYLSLYGTNVPHFFIFICYFICALIIVFVYNWIGNEMTVSTSAIYDAVAMMDWSGLGVKTRLFLLQIIVHVNLPIAFSAGGVMTLSLETFTQIVKICYSFYHMLQTVTNKTKK